jgi:O-methyltransferase domain
MESMVDAPELAARYMRLVDGFLTTQLLYVAASLDVGGRLAGGPMSGPDLAASLGVDREALTRVLRGLVAEGVPDEDDQGRFALTPLGGCLSSLRGATVARGALYYDAAAGLLQTVRDGGTSFEHVHGASFFEHLQRHPDHYDVFQGSMAGRAEQEARDVVAAYEFTGLRRLVDVGGGPAVMLAEILRAVPELAGVMMDREAVVARAREHLDRSGVGDRAECVPGDFFVTVPAGGDAYLLSRVLHDWDDGDAARILATCRSAMEPGVRLLVVEAILPERASDAPAVIRMDLHMLVLLGARERTEAEFRNLLGAAGFTVHRVVRTGSSAGLGIIEAVAGSTAATWTPSRRA